jgi:NitT/TauT family transport system permease protein
LASPFVETAQPLNGRKETGRAAGPPQAFAGGRGLLAILAPAIIAVAALLVHRFVPNKQIDFPTSLYPLLLQALVALGVVMALAHWAFQPLRAKLRHYGPLLAGFSAWLCLWDLTTLKLAWLPLPYFPGPDMVLQGVWSDRVLLLESTVDSLQRLLTGYFAGVTLGLLFGVLMGWFRDVRYWGVPIMKVIGPIPATALIPTAMVLFPGAFVPGVALIAFAVCFPVTMLTMSGIMNVPASYFDVARTLGAQRGYLIFRVAIPGALPNIFIGLFMGLLASFLVLAVAEAVGVKNGLGWYVEWRRNAAEYDRVFGALFIMSVFFSGILTLLFKVRDWVLGWQKGVIRW